MKAALQDCKGYLSYVLPTSGSQKRCNRGSRVRAVLLFSRLFPFPVLGFRFQGPETPNITRALFSPEQE